MIETVKNNPVMTAVTVLVAQSAGLLVAFGVHLNDAQITAVSSFAVSAIAVGLYVRQLVRPTRKDTV